MHRCIHRQNQAAGLQGLGVLQQLLSFGFDDKQFLRHAEQALAQVGQAHGALVAVKQQNPVALFEFAHLVGNRRLRQKQALGGLGKASMHRHGMESFELGVGHRHGNLQ
ncbi:hypothetical protein D3C78_1734670 [compost metagenome]